MRWRLILDEHELEIVHIAVVINMLANLSRIDVDPNYIIEIYDQT